MSDINECATDVDNCAPNATCTNTPVGSFTCTCDQGYSGDGTSCEGGSRYIPDYNAPRSCHEYPVDIDECANNIDNCHPTLAQCTNTIGSFSCACLPGYSGDGLACTGEHSTNDNPQE